MTLKAMPLRAPSLKLPTYLNQVADVTPILTPRKWTIISCSEHFDVYVAPIGEDLGNPSEAIAKIVADTQAPAKYSHQYPRPRDHHELLVPQLWLRTAPVRLLVYLVLVAQFAPLSIRFLIILAVPTGLVGVMLTLAFTDTTLNIQSLMGIVMLHGHGRFQQHSDRRFRQCVSGRRPQRTRRCRPLLPHSLASYSHDFARHHRRFAAYGFEARNGKRSLRAASPRRLSEDWLLPLLLTIFVVPAAYLLIYRRRDQLQVQRALLGGPMSFLPALRVVAAPTHFQAASGAKASRL